MHGMKPANPSSKLKSVTMKPGLRPCTGPTSTPPDLADPMPTAARQRSSCTSLEGSRTEPVPRRNHRPAPRAECWPRRLPPRPGRAAKPAIPATRTHPAGATGQPHRQSPGTTHDAIWPRPAGASNHPRQPGRSALTAPVGRPLEPRAPSVDRLRELSHQAPPAAATCDPEGHLRIPAQWHAGRSPTTVRHEGGGPAQPGRPPSSTSSRALLSHPRAMNAEHRSGTHEPQHRWPPTAAPPGSLAPTATAGHRRGTSSTHEGSRPPRRSDPSPHEGSHDGRRAAMAKPVQVGTYTSLQLSSVGPAPASSNAAPPVRAPCATNRQAAGRASKKREEVRRLPVSGRSEWKGMKILGLLPFLYPGITLRP